MVIHDYELYVCVIYLKMSEKKKEQASLKPEERERDKEADRHTHIQGESFTSPI